MSSHNEVIQLIRMSTIIMALILGTILILTGNKKRPRFLLGVFVILYGLEGSIHVFKHFMDLPFHPRDLFTPFNFAFLAPPVLYLYLKKLARGISFREKKDWVHLFPASCEFLFGLFVTVNKSTNQIPDSVFFELFDWYVLLSGLFVVFYAGLILFQIKKFAAEIEEYYSSVDWKQLSGLRIVAVSMAIITFIIGFLYFGIAGGLDSNKISVTLPVVILNLLFVTGAGLLGVFQQRLLPEQKLIQEFNQEMETKQSIQMVKENPSFGDVELLNRKKFQALEEHMGNEKPYLDSELNAFDLAKSLNLSQRNLSRIITENGYLNFNNYVNHYRIEEAKRLLQSPESANLTMIGIGFEAGFNSKATFYSTFKKYTGLTPSQFHKD